jgi:TetR/AcrR family transcriptional repressor of nem operon
VVAAYEECWRHSQPVLDAIFSPLVPPLERFSKWCAFAYEKGKAQFEAHGHVCGCPYASLGSEVGTQDEKLRAKSQELVEKSVRYVESALTDAKSRGLVQIANPASAAKAVYSCAMGIVLRAKLENDPEILRELEPSILQMIGAQTVAA